MRSWIIGLTLVAGCDQVFGLDPRPADAADPTGDSGDGGGGMGGGILTPPASTGNACSPRPVFESWTFTRATLAFNESVPITGLGFYQAGGETRSIVTAGNRLYDVAANGEATPLTTLDPPGSAFVRAPGLSPEGSVVWFQQTGIASGVYYATRASSWVKHRADLGFIDAEMIEPGSVGYFEGTARMVITVRVVGSEATLREVSSNDGLTWTMLDTVHVVDRSFNPHLSRDGCYLLFSHSGTFTELRVATRDNTGAFTTSVSFVPASLTTAANTPALVPDASRLWFTCDGMLCRGDQP